MDVTGVSILAEDKRFCSPHSRRFQVIESKGREGNCVIVGRGGPYILCHRDDTFRVFIYGSREEKIRRLVKLKMDRAEATCMVDTIDAERAAFVRKYFAAEWPSRHLYHILLNTDPGIEYATETILATMEALERYPQAANHSQNTALDLIRH